jgi:hypothetical protein
MVAPVGSMMWYAAPVALRRSTVTATGAVAVAGVDD